MNKFYYGCHISSSAHKLIDISEYIRSIGGNLIQMFITKRSPEEIKEFVDYNKKHNIQIVIHASYTINIASNWDHYSHGVNQLISEIKKADNLGAFGIVVHLGKQLDLKLNTAYDNMVSSLMYVHNKTKHTNVKILIETSAGQGTEMCYKIEDLAYFYKKFSKHHNQEIRNRFKLCIDTCHIFAAGYDISNKKRVQIYFDMFEELIGVNNVWLIHFNDSKNPVGDRIDRHANIGEGYIGKDALMTIAKIAKKLFIPLAIETPSGCEKEIVLISKINTINK